MANKAYEFQLINPEVATQTVGQMMLQQAVVSQSGGAKGNIVDVIEVVAQEYEQLSKELRFLRRLFALSKKSQVHLRLNHIGTFTIWGDESYLSGHDCLLEVPRPSWALELPDVYPG